MGQFYKIGDGQWREALQDGGQFWSIMAIILVVVRIMQRDTV